MKQMDIDAKVVSSLDYSSMSLPASVREFRPILYQEGSLFCCLLGPDPQMGVFGCGETREEAIKDWEADLQRRLRRGPI